MSKYQYGTTIVTSGKFRGMTLLTPGGETHPMGSREKLALFNMIGSYLPGASVLDAYAGSGALGIEALSRGAGRVVFLDKSIKATEVIRQNLTNLGLDNGSWEVRKGDVVNEAKSKPEKYEVILADPPYEKYKPEMITELDRLMSEGGILVTSTPVEPPEINNMKLLKTRKYARAYISVYVKNVL